MIATLPSPNKYLLGTLPARLNLHLAGVKVVLELHVHIVGFVAVILLLSVEVIGVSVISLSRASQRFVLRGDEDIERDTCLGGGQM